MKVSVFGLGYVGSVTAACLASLGHQVIGVDVNPFKVDSMNGGVSPILEPGLTELIQTGRACGNLRATQDAFEAVAGAEILLICVGTPSDTNGNLNFGFIDHVCGEIAKSLRGLSGFKVIAIRSTLLPGVIQQRLIPLLEKESGKKLHEDFGVASNPEFLREGSAIEDFKNPPFTIIGEADRPTGAMLDRLYHDLPAPVYHTDPDSACMLKYTCNAFHGLKVAFANEIGRLSKEAGMDGGRIMELFCQDTRLNISPRYLKPGFAFGGSCLPKDLRAISYLARHADLRLPVLESILTSNRLHIQGVAELILRDHGRSSVGIIGLTFKHGTDDLRESPMVELVEILSGKGLAVKIFDNSLTLSKIVGGNKAFIESALPHISAMMVNTLEDAVLSSDVIVVAHDLREETEHFVGLLKPDQLVIDLVRIMPDEVNFPAAYEGVCW